MTADLIAPAILAVLAATTGGWLRRRVHPNVAVVLLTALAVLGAFAVFWALTLVVIGGAIGVPALMEELGWCRRVLAASHRAPAVVAVVAGALLVTGIIRAVRFDLRWRRTLRRCDGGDGEVQIVPTAELIAFAVPGRPGTVVVSEGLIAVLAADERAAVVAHERTHLSQHHSRYLRIAGAAAAAVPVLVPLTKRLRFATERAADEAAASAVGDRRIVARALLRAALATPPPGALGIGGDDVRERVEELVHPPMAGGLPAAAALCAVILASATVMASSVQLHHLIAFSVHVCGLS